MERLLYHVRAITQEISSRLAASVTERSAAFYVENTLNTWGIASTRQKFPTIERFSKRLTPQFALSSAVLGGSLASKGLWRGLAGCVGGFLAWHDWRIFHGHPALWEDSLADYHSRNVIVRLPAQKAAQKRVVLVAHLDSGFRRSSHHPKMLPILPYLLGFSGLATGLGSLLALLGGEGERSKEGRAYLSGGLMLMALLAAWDEFGLPVAGANDNASGLAVALEVAAYLKQNPLPETEVWLVFTGSETAGGVGLEHFLQAYITQVRDAYFLVLRAVGAGELAWVSKNTLNAILPYQAHPAALKWLEQTAQNHPEWGIMGREMPIFDEVAVLNRYGLKGACLTSYDRETGYSPHLYQKSDTLENIEPETLQRAFMFTLAALGKS